MHNMMMHPSWKSRSALQNLGLAVDGFVLFIKSLIWSFLCMVCIGYGLFGINLYTDDANQLDLARNALSIMPVLVMICLTGVGLHFAGATNF